MISDDFQNLVDGLSEIRGSHRSIIYEGVRRKDGSKCVIKAVPKTLLRLGDVHALRKELEQLSQLRHPNLVRIFEFGEDAELVWLMTEKVEGVPLDDPSLHPTESDLVSWANVLLDTLAYLHDRGIIHHDIKAANVLISREQKAETLKLIDLGLASQRYARTSRQILRGTLGYLAPELFGSGAVDLRIDLFSTGILFEKLAGGRVSGSFSQWLQRMHAQEPDDRFPHAKAARAALIGEGSAETILEPFLLDSLPWGRCRTTWNEILSLLTDESRGRVLLRGAREEIRSFGRSMGAALFARGSTCTILDATGSFSPSERSELDLRAHEGGSVLWLEAEDDCRPSGKWSEFRLQPYRLDELKSLIEATHPDLLLESTHIHELCSKTGGAPTEVRKFLSGILKSRPTVEEFRQRFTSTLLTWVPTETSHASHDSADLLLRVLQWAKQPLPLQWFVDETNRIFEEASSGRIRHFEEMGVQYIEPVVSARVDELPSREIEWLESKLTAALPASLHLCELYADLALRARMRDTAVRGGRRLLFRLLRKRQYERALVWLDRLVLPLSEGLRGRLLLEIGRVSDAHSLIETLPSSPLRKKLLRKLAFVEGKYSECEPNPEVLIRQGRYLEAYDKAIEGLSRTSSKRRLADLERTCGLAAHYEGNLDQAFTHFNRSRQLWRKIGDPSGYGQTLNQWGMTLAKSGDVKRAARAYRHAAMLAAAVGDRRRSLTYTLNLGIAELGLGNVTSTLRAFERGRTAARLLGLSTEAASIAQNLANIWLQSGHPDRALRLLEEINPWITQSGTRVLQCYQKILQADVALARKEKEKFIGLVNELETQRDDVPRLSGSIQNLIAERAFVRGNVDQALHLLGGEDSDLSQRNLLQSEWEWEAGTITPEELKSRYEKWSKSSSDFLMNLRQLRFLGLIHRAQELSGALKTESAELRKKLQKNVPPEIWGPLQNQLADWFSETSPPAESDIRQTSEGSLGSFSVESRGALAVFLKVARRITVGSSDTLFRTILGELMKLANTPRGGIILKRGQSLHSHLFFGREWELEVELPVEFSRSIANAALSQNRAIVIRDASKTDDEYGTSLRTHRLRGIACFPLRAENEPIGAVYLDDPDRPLQIEAEDVEILQGVADQAAVALHNALLIEKLHEEHRKVTDLNRQLADRTDRQEKRLANLEQLRRPYGMAGWEKFGIVGKSDAIRNIADVVERAASTTERILIVGENGTEKEALARAIVEIGGRSDRPFVVVDCSAIPEALFEAELFGYVAGAFTGAATSQTGLMRSAGDGTIFLHSIDSLSSSLQVKLLRVLQENRIRPVGGTDEMRLTAHVIASVNDEPQKLIGNGRLRDDLYFRLARVEIRIPPLRERLEDLPYLVKYILGELARTSGVSKRVTRPVMAKFARHSWPGNRWELTSELERAFVHAKENRIDLADLSETFRFAYRAAHRMPKRRKPFPSLRREMERRILVEALKEAKGSCRQAATRLDMPISTFYHKLKQHGVALEKK